MLENGVQMNANERKGLAIANGGWGLSRRRGGDSKNIFGQGGGLRTRRASFFSYLRASRNYL